MSSPSIDRGESWMKGLTWQHALGMTKKTELVGGIKDMIQGHREDMGLLFPFLLYVRIEFTYYNKMTKS